MKQKYMLLILLVIIISITSISVLAVTPNIELTPPTQSVNQGTQATIEVVVKDVTDLKGANIILNFDASKLQYASSADGGFIPGALLAPPTVDNINGSVTLDIASIISYTSGTGTIMSVTFDTIGAGNGSITFGVTTLRDKDNLIIDHTIGSGCIVTVSTIELTSIVVLPETMTLFEGGETESITSITAHYSDAFTVNIALGDCTYSSDDENVATVAAGVVTSVNPGTATITVTYQEDGVTKTDTIGVTVEVILLTEIVVLQETMNLFSGDSEFITSITAHYNNGATVGLKLNDCTYSSDDESIATVAVGVITAVEAGTATITVSFTEGGITKTDTVVVTVNAKLENITVLPETMTLFVGEDRTITSITASYNYGSACRL